MTKDKALKLAIEAFENYRFELRHEIINACKEALEQPAQEPVGVVSWHEGTVMGSIFPSNNMPKDGEFLYIYPVQTLMDDDCREIAEENFKLGYETCKKNQPAQEDEIKALKEKNNG